MPVFTWEEYYKRTTSGQGLTEDEIWKISFFMEHDLGEELKKSEKTKTIGNRIMKFADAVSDLFRPKATSPDEVFRKKQEALLELDGLKDFLESIEPESGKNNYELIRDSLSESDFRLFLNYLAILNEKCGTGISKEMIEPQWLKEKEDNPDLNTSDLLNRSNLLDTSNLLNTSGVIREPDDKSAFHPAFPGAEQKVKINKSQQDIEMSHITAAEYIEKIRDLKYETNEDGEYNVRELKERFLKIMAARLLADSVRGKRDRLDSKLLTGETVEKMAEKLGNSPMMTGFMSKLKNDPDLLEKAVEAAQKGHGGGLDDLFREYIRNLPAGEFKNEQGLERYMPTGKERIEILQKQAKELMEREKWLPAELPERKALSTEKRKIIFEIAGIRNLLHAGRKEKDQLDKTVPTEEDGKQLDQRVTKAAKAGYSAAQEKIFNKHFPDCLEGHGGQMVLAFRDIQKRVDPMALGGESVSFFSEGTIGNGIMELSEKAGNLIYTLNLLMDDEADDNEMEDDLGDNEIEDDPDLEALGINLDEMDFENMDYDDPEVQEFFQSMNLDPDQVKGKTNAEIVQLFKKMVQEAKGEKIEEEAKAEKKTKEDLEDRIDQALNEDPKKREAFVKHMEEGKKIIAEYLLLGGMATNPETQEIEQDYLYKEMPWKVVDKIRTEGPGVNPEFRSYSDLISPGKMFGILKIISNAADPGAPSAVADKLVDIKYNHDKVKNPAVMKPKKSLTVKVQSDPVVKQAVQGPGVN